VSTLVGGWKAETTWVMIDALQEGNLGLALTCLDKLLTAGEAPQKILGGINYTFRRLAQATELARQGTSLNAALKQAGVRKIDLSSRYLRRIGRPRAEKFHAWMLEADANLKGSSRLSERMHLEELLVRLSGAQPVL
jgi:DNA polymerase III subunit delta